ncbi:LacI family DNA-binding transcriptional regulator, partial [Spirochaetia bacterium 38H-sp]
MNKRKVTIKDVAKMAGVSPSTVSRAIYDSAPLKQETKDRIFYAMAKLNYYPNAAARSLVQKKTMSLGVILPNDEGDLFLNPFFIHALRGLSVYAQSCHYFILYAFSKDQNQELEYIKELYRSRRVDGFVMLTVREKDDCIDYMQSQSIPFVVIGHPIPDDKMLWVDNDNFQAMYKLTNWMIDRGYRDFVFLGGP